ncbi:MAG: hypothetical protein ABFC62_10430 [Clostridiaceae bacterium]
MVDYSMESTYRIKKRKYSIALILYLFMLVFDLPLLPQITIMTPLSIVSLIYLMWNKRDTAYAIRYTQILKLIAMWVGLFAFIALCTAVRLLQTNQELLQISNVAGFLLKNSCLLICTLFIVAFCRKMQYNTSDLLNIYIIVGLIQASIVLLTAAFPQVRELTLQILRSNTRSELVFRAIEDMSGVRGFGFSSNLFDLFGYATSILITIAVACGVFGKRILVLAAIFMIPMPLLNARTGLVIAVLGVIIVFVQYFRSSDMLLRKIGTGIVIGISGVALIFVATFIMSQYPSTSEWVMDGIEETKRLVFNQEKTGIYSYLLSSSFWFFPDNLLELIFGAGSIPLYLINRNTDVGYVISVWQYGLIGTIILYVSYFWLFYRANKSSKSELESSLVFFFFVAFAAFSLKMDALGINQASLIYFPLCFKMIYDANVGVFNNANSGNGGLTK